MQPQRNLRRSTRQASSSKATSKAPATVVTKEQEDSEPEMDRSTFKVRAIVLLVNGLVQKVFIMVMNVSEAISIILTSLVHSW